MKPIVENTGSTYTIHATDGSRSSRTGSWRSPRSAGTISSPRACTSSSNRTAMKVTFALVAVALLTSYQPTVSVAPVQQAQTRYFVSDEDKFLNSVMVRAYNYGDSESLKELLQYWQDEHSTAI